MTQKSTKGHEIITIFITSLSPSKEPTLNKEYTYWVEMICGIILWSMIQREGMSLEGHINCFPVISRMDCAVCHCLGIGYNSTGGNNVFLFQSQLTTFFQPQSG